MDASLMVARKRPAGMTGFTIIWLGQLVSVVATQMTQFAMTLWIYQLTNSVMALGLAQIFYITPFLLITPIAGVMIDRYSRKLMMMVSDIGAGAATAGLLTLQALGHLQIWHVYTAMVVMGLVNAFQWPSYSAAITTMVAKNQYGRANGMMSMVDAGPGVIAPLLAGSLIGFIKLTGILMIDVITYGLAIITLALVFVPQPERTVDGDQSGGNLWAQSVFGFRYIFARPSLLGLLTLFLVGNLFSGIAGTLFAPFVLAHTGNNSVMMGTVQSAAALAAVLGAVAMSIWGGFKHRINGVVWGWFLSSLFGMFLFGFGKNLAVWIPTIMLLTVFGPLINSSSQSIWQSKVAPDVQGRVFSTRRLIAWITQPIAPVIAGSLADYLLEPAMKSGGSLAHTFGGLFGTGPGAGMGMLICLCGLLDALSGLAGRFVPTIWKVEQILPDHDQSSIVNSGITK